MKYACQYAIIRFMPFVETGEFANIGIALFCPETGYFNFRISDRKTRKVNSFFAPVPTHIYPEGIKDINAELARIKKLIEGVHQSDLSFAKGIFHELVRTREATFRFSEIRGILTDNLETKTEELFSHYVERGFVTDEYTEKLSNRIGRVLSSIGVGDAYKRMDFKKKNVSVRMPFTYADSNGKAVKAIKPLPHFASDVSQAFGDGWSLYGRMGFIRDALPDKVLVASEPPKEEDDYGWESFHQLEEKFESIDIQLVSDENKLMDFARLQ